MIQRLLFFSILRTRSARKKLVARAVIVFPCLALCVGCENRAPKPDIEPPPREQRRVGEMPADMKEELARLEAEAGVDLSTDPTPPSGDLKQDVDSFTTLDTCVRKRATTDPLLGDAIEALGYDTFTRDACRILQALKAKNAALCKTIAASPLRTRCTSYVATLVGDPALCPTAQEAGKLGARDPMCLARASRDERLCAAAMSSDRTTCKALVLGDPKECGRNESCVRQVERWKTLVDKPSRHPPLTGRLHVEVTDDKSGRDSNIASFDMDDVATAGAVVKFAGDKVRLSLGTPKSVLWPAWDAPGAAPKLYVEVQVPSNELAAKSKPDAAMAIALATTDLKLDLLLPKVALLSSTTSSDRKLEIVQWSSEFGGPVQFVVSTRVSDAPRSFLVKITVETFVRDVAGPRAERPAEP